jgi:hypothetical protein
MERKHVDGLMFKIRAVQEQVASPSSARAGRGQIRFGMLTWSFAGFTSDGSAHAQSRTQREWTGSEMMGNVGEDEQPWDIDASTHVVAVSTYNALDLKTRKLPLLSLNLEATS